MRILRVGALIIDNRFSAEYALVFSNKSYLCSVHIKINYAVNKPLNIAFQEPVIGSRTTPKSFTLKI